MLFAFVANSQTYAVSGKVIDNNGEAISFSTVLLIAEEDTSNVTGVVTNDDGTFNFSELNKGSYTLQVSYIGFETHKQDISIISNRTLQAIILQEAEANLDEVFISVKTPTIIREAGKLIFNVENTSLSVGDTYNLLKKTPGVLVLGNQISIKKSTPIIYLNNKRVYLTNGELISLLKSMDASNIKSVEVITIPSAKYDAEAESVLNIITSKAVSIGYKGSINTTYEQAVYSKYRFSTAHFYKNDRLNAYASYSFSPRKEYKQDDNFVRFFNPDNATTKSIWESDFEKVTKSNAHQGNLILDFNLNKKNALSFSSTVLVSPNKRFKNYVLGEIFNEQRDVDSTFKTKSNVTHDTKNLSFNLEHTLRFNENKSSLTTSVNYILYDNSQAQNLTTDYNLPSGDLINNIRFFTDANQDSNIFTAQTDFNNNLSEGSFETGIKYSNIDTESGLDFFNFEGDTPQINEALSDLFIYKESIFAGYVNYSKKWGDLSFNAGIRGEYTDVKGNSKSLGIVNNQDYFDFFPAISSLYNLNENNSIGISYRRSIERPRYQSLNPFSYFITDNISNSGNPNLNPSIKNKYALSFTHKNKWVFEGYYIYYKNPLTLLTFQDNLNNNTQAIDTNIISDINYSLDISYSSPLYSWWYLMVYTSTYYLENEFLSIASEPEIYSNNTLGFYLQMYNGLTLSKDKTITSDITLLYISNLIYGSFDYKNTFNFSVSFRKSLWNKRASISIGVDDLFDTTNIPLTSRYYNQDNGYFAKHESRLFRLGFKYNFGNFKLRNNNRNIKIKESERLD